MEKLSLEEENKIKIEVLKNLEDIISIIDNAGYVVDPELLIEIEITNLESSEQELNYETSKAMLTLLMLMRLQSIFHSLQTSLTLECEDVLLKSFQFSDQLIMQSGNDYASPSETKEHLEGFVQAFFDAIEEQKINFIQLESISESLIKDVKSNTEDLPGFIDEYLEATFTKINMVTKHDISPNKQANKYVEDINELNHEVKNLVLNIFSIIEQDAEFEISIEDINKVIMKSKNNLLIGEEWNNAVCSSLMHVLYKLNTGVSQVSGQLLEDQWIKVDHYKNELTNAYFDVFVTREWLVPEQVTKLYLYDLIDDACSTFFIKLLMKNSNVYAQKSSLSIKPKIDMIAELYFHPITIMN